MDFDRRRGFHVTNSVTVADLEPGVLLSGVRPGLVTVVAATPLGESVNLVFRDGAGEYGDRLLYPADLAALVIQAPKSPVEFRRRRGGLQARRRGQRIKLAGLSDPMLAVTTSDIQPLPHQIRAVYGELLPRTPLRFLLADDPGAGKTIMAGLYIKELMLREDVKRCLIVAPGGLVEQWQDELFFEVRARVRDPHPATWPTTAGRQPRVFEQHPLLIARMDQLARNEELLRRAREVRVGPRRRRRGAPDGRPLLRRQAREDQALPARRAARRRSPATCC